MTRETREFAIPREDGWEKGSFMEFCDVISLLLTRGTVLQAAISDYTKQPQMLPHGILNYIFIKKNKTIAVRQISVLICYEVSKNCPLFLY